MIRPIDEIWLEKGNHLTPERGMCAMEACAWLAGEQHSDMPLCVDGELMMFVRSFNDAADDETRQYLKPLLPYMIGTYGDGLAGARCNRASAGTMAGRHGDFNAVIRMIDPLGERREELYEALESAITAHSTKEAELVA